MIILNNQYFIDLLNEYHLQINKMKERLWNEKSDIYISNSEWLIIKIIFKSSPTISNVSKRVNISRQATHKFIKSLETKGLLEIKNIQNNKKEKCVQLTKLGEQCFEQYEVLMEKIEKEICEKIGQDKFEVLIEILKTNCGLEK
ncbi:MarR family winged helix-turn-helix transcriptional regulator [Lysinibacillus telephonicus]|uniref:MarR family winged helix-turn-helix transcriptional regulator n=1 Tax=Lysinibacillus telephonicus TaxID=1714840 RepID=UPI00319DC52D